MIKALNKILIASLALLLPLSSLAASQSVDENVTINGYFTTNGGALSMTATSGFLNLSGLSASLINTGANSLSLIGSPLYLNATGTGNTSIGSASGTVTLTVGSDAIGDIYYRNSGGNLARLAIGSAGQVLIASGTPKWSTIAPVPTGTINYSTLNWNTGTTSWQENTAFLANGGALSGVTSIDTISASPTSLSFANDGTLATAIGNLTLQPASGTVSLDSASNLTGNSALTISTASNPLMINSSKWTVNSSGTLVLTTSDGIFTVGEAFPNKSISTDNGIGMYNAATSTAMKSGLFTEVDGTLLSYGINVTQIGNRDTTKAGGIFRMDTRSGSPYFSVKRQIGSPGTEYSDIQISTAGDIGMGGWASDSNSFPGNVSILARTSSTIGFVVRDAVSQTADLTQWQDSAGNPLLEINSAGTITTPSGTALNITSGGTGAINIGTDANAKTITIGNSTGATALNFLSGTGNIYFTVNGSGSSGIISMGNSNTATPDLLTLDKGTADPTGATGGMYYSTNLNQFRGYQNGAWKSFAMAASSSRSVFIGAAQAVQEADGSNNNADSWMYYDYATPGDQFNRIYGNAATQDLDIVYQTIVPSDFSSWDTTSAIAVTYKTSSATTTTSKVSCAVYNTAGTLVYTAPDAASTTKSTITIGAASISSTWTPGSSFVINCKGTVNSAATADVGKVILKYNY